MRTVSSSIMTECIIWKDLVKPEDNVYWYYCENIYHKECIEKWLRNKRNWPTWKAKLDINKMRSSRIYINAAEKLEKKKQNAIKIMKKRDICERHQKQSELYCRDCDVSIWTYWHVEGKHENCKIEHINETIKRYKSCLSNKLDEISQAKLYVKKIISSFNFEKWEKWIDNTTRNLKLAINKVIDEELKELKGMLESLNTSTKFLQNTYSELSDVYSEGKRLLRSEE